MYISRNLDQWNAFLAMLQTAFEQGKAQDLLTLLLTADERDAVGLRLQIVSQLLDKNLSQREIQQNLNTSAATITRGSNMIKTMDPDFMEWVRQHLDSVKKN
ncbi:trp operon repressor [Rodentibacter pneumotropicus]|uniref:Trp operon repressor homolog n=2 Tax=Rodentibacter TaxID=1960084 RepID=A0A4S2PVG3_9PAST|nr:MULTISPECIES: trp operon repressor [Rodentibacter]MDC2825212.1 trp operon repressor [Rodentibacter pneumotropicus]OOF82550.1 Trp operon repressor [Rodentibacter ratti]THA07963.1 trp operon repressor [Rodentibacter pneumotropicus]